MTGPIAWLGMYDHPRQHAANDALWGAIAERLMARGVRDVPSSLARSLAPVDAWTSSRLLLGQICTRPLVRHHPSLQVLAHPVYRIAAAPGYHHSLIVVRAGSAFADLVDLCGRTLAINDAGSNTGVALLRDMLPPIARGRPFFDRIVTSGSHRSSALAVAEGRADVAAIDIVTWASLDRYEADITTRLRIIATSAPAATPPFVTARDTLPETVAALRSVLADVIADPALQTIRDTLLLADIVPPRADLFDRVAAQDACASRRGSAVLAGRDDHGSPAAPAIAVTRADIDSPGRRLHRQTDRGRTIF